VTRPYSLPSSLTTNYTIDGGYTEIVYGPVTIGFGNILTIGSGGLLVIL
jgi:hypothetical protein